MSLSRHIRTTVLALAVAAVAACSTSPPKPVVDYKQDYDFSAVQKIAFYDQSGEVVGDNPLQLSDIQKGRIDTALAYAVNNKGLQMVDDPAEADLLLSWHLVTQQQTDVQTWSTGVGVGYGGYYNRYSAYSCWSCMPMQTDVTVRNYTQGTFIVDLIDPTLKKSVWRSVIESRLKEELSQNQVDYNDAATNILASFPPGSAPAP